MPLKPEPHAPHVCSGEVRGADGSVAWLMTHPEVPTIDLWAQDADRRNMARVQLNLAGVLALQQLLGEVAAAMRDGDGWPDRPGSNGQPPA